MKYYAVRQARSKVIGSRIMTKPEAERECRVWNAEIGPAAAIPATPEVRRAVHRDDAATLARLLAEATQTH